jgi:hypothetical protein
MQWSTEKHRCKRSESQKLNCNNINKSNSHRSKQKESCRSHGAGQNGTHQEKVLQNHEQSQLTKHMNGGSSEGRNSIFVEHVLSAAKHTGLTFQYRHRFYHLTGPRTMQVRCCGSPATHSAYPSHLAVEASRAAALLATSNRTPTTAAPWGACPC